MIGDFIGAALSKRTNKLMLFFYCADDDQPFYTIKKSSINGKC